MSLLEPFVQALRHSTESNEINLFNFDGVEPLSSPRSLAAVRYEGLTTEDLMPQAAPPPAGTARFQALFAGKRQEQCRRYVDECRRRYRELEKEAQRFLAHNSLHDLEEALQQREANQRMKEERMREAKAKLLDKMLDDQLRLRTARASAEERVRGKEETVERKRQEMNRRLQEHSQAKLLASRKKKQAVDEAAAAALEDSERRREAKERAASEAHERTQRERQREGEVRRQRAEQKKADMEDKKHKCRDERRAHVVALLEKRSETQRRLNETLEKRAGERAEREEASMLRTLMIQQHVARGKAKDAVSKERARGLVEDKRKRADRLEAIRTTVKASQAALDKRDRERRRALEQWKAEAEISGNFNVPVWLHDPQAPVPPPDTRTCVKPPEKEHYSPWVYNAEVV